MARSCEICEKRPSFGYTYSRRGLAKAKGGVGKKITGKTARKFLPNVQKIRVLVNGGVRRMRVCTKCIRNGKVEKPSIIKHSKSDSSKQAS